MGAAHAETVTPRSKETIATRRTRQVYEPSVASAGMVLTDDLSRLARRAARSGIFCDFDGCLAPIVPDPAQARAVEGAAGALERLAGRFLVVAVVSGRSVSDLASRIDARGVRLIGLHGMEELREGEVRVSAVAEAARTAVERAAARLERELAGAPGAVLERKGLALAVHFRRAADPEAAERISPPALVDRADVAVGSPAEFVALLDELAGSA